MAETVTIQKEKYKSMKETLDIMSDSKLLEDIREGIKDIRKGKTISLDKYLKKWLFISFPPMPNSYDKNNSA